MPRTLTVKEAHDLASQGKTYRARMTAKAVVLDEPATLDMGDGVMVEGEAGDYLIVGAGEGSAHLVPRVTFEQTWEPS